MPATIALGQSFAYFRNKAQKAAAPLALTLSPSQGGGGWPEVGASMDADFANDRYYWNGAARSRSDFVTVAGGTTPVWSAEGIYCGDTDRLKFPDLSWFNAAEGTLVIDLYKPAASTAFAFSMSPAGSTPRLEINQLSTGINRATLTPAMADVPMLAQSIEPKRNRVVLNYKNGELCSGVSSGALTSPLGASNYTTQSFPNSAAIGWWVFSPGSGLQLLGYISRIRFFTTRQTDAKAQEIALRTTRTNLHMLGDSFADSAQYRLIETGLAGPYRVYTSDGVGGSSLAEQNTRYTATPQYWDRTLIIVDGGLTDSDPIQQIAAITSHTTSGRWGYMQAGYDRTWSPSTVATRLALDASIKAAYPNNFIDTYAYMRANGGGGTVGTGGGEVWALNNYGDDLHQNTTGKTNLANCIAAWLNAKGW